MEVQQQADLSETSGSSQQEDGVQNQIAATKQKSEVELATSTDTCKKPPDTIDHPMVSSQ